MIGRRRLGTLVGAAALLLAASCSSDTDASPTTGDGGTDTSVDTTVPIISANADDGDANDDSVDDDPAADTTTDSTAPDTADRDAADSETSTPTGSSADGTDDSADDDAQSAISDDDADTDDGGDADDDAAANNSTDDSSDGDPADGGDSGGTPTPDDVAPPAGGCDGVQPAGWIDQVVVDIDVDGDGRADNVGTFTTPDGDTVLAVAWAAGGWSSVAINGDPDEGDSRIAGLIDLDDNGVDELVITNPGPLPDLSVQIAEVRPCELRLLVDTRTESEFETITFAQFESFSGLRCEPGAGISLNFGSIIDPDSDVGQYEMVQLPASLINGALVYDDDAISRLEINDIEEYAPVANCGGEPS